MGIPVLPLHRSDIDPKAGISARRHAVFFELEPEMKSCLTALILLASIAPAFANADDDAWIKRCVSDNADQKQSAETVAVYCACMNGKMSTAETMSVTAWEKKHPAEQEQCSSAAGWK